MSSLVLIANHHTPPKFDKNTAREIGNIAAAKAQARLRAITAPIARNVAGSAVTIQGTKTTNGSENHTSAAGPAKAQTIAAGIHRWRRTAFMGRSANTYFSGGR